MYLPRSEQFGERRAEIARATVHYTLSRFDDEGNWIGPDFGNEMREFMWYSLAFFEEGSDKAVRRANRLIQKNIPGYRLCHFMPFIGLQALFHYENKMERQTVALLDEYIEKYIPEFMLPELDFSGSNDNFPCMSSAAVLFAGQRYHKPEYIEKARERLRQLIEMLDRRGFTSEYTSPTYTPIQTIALAEIVHFAKDEDIRQMALLGEQRTIADMLMHMHWPTAQLSGPFSRSYPVDAVACSHHARFLYFMLYGHELSVGPMETVFAAEDGLEGTVMHHANGDFLKISAMWQAVPDYHCPEGLWEWAKNRNYPYICAGTSESSSRTDSAIKVLPSPSEPITDIYENPSRSTFIYTYMTEAYALGTSRFALRDGYQSESPRLLYKKKPVVSSQEDVGSMFVRYVFNDAPIDWIENICCDMGKNVCLQRENSAMAAYYPSFIYNEGIYSLKLAVCFAALYGEPDEIWVGEQKVAGDGVYAGTAPVYVRDGDLYVMLYPIAATPITIEIKRVEKLVEISFVNYRGEPRDFTREELLRIGNGVAVEVREKKDIGGFDAFRAMMQPTCDDTWLWNCRKCRYENNGHSMELEYSPRSQSLRYVSLDGRRVEEPRIYSSDPVVYGQIAWECDANT